MNLYHFKMDFRINYQKFMINWLQVHRYWRIKKILYYFPLELHYVKVILV